MTAPLPTRKQERWRYADFKAVEQLWPAPPARLISVPAGRHAEEVVRVRDGGIHDIRVEVGEGASLALVLVVISDSYARVAVDAHLQARSAIDIGGIILGRGDSVQEIVTDVRHENVAATSRQRVRLVLDDMATGSFLGQIAIPRIAQKTDADQSGRAIILKRTATANLKPELEVFADDVQACHGCTVGELDHDSMFYLQSRGLPRADAEALLTQAFVADAFTGLADEKLRDELHAEAIQWLQARAERAHGSGANGSGVNGSGA